MSEALIFGGVRTPRGRGKAGKGGLSGIHPQELFAQSLNALQGKLGFSPEKIEDVIAGCVTQVKEQGACIARNAVLAADWPDDVTGATVNRFCGSGLQAINFAAMGVASGFQQAVVAGGVESMSRVPMGCDDALMDGHNLQLRERVPQVPQGISADLIAAREGFSRKDLDAYAAESQARAAVAMKENRFSSIFAVKNSAGETVLEADEHPRPGTTVETLSELRPAFEKLGQSRFSPEGQTMVELALAKYPDVKAIDHVHTAGNSSGIVDGACAVLVASSAWGKENQLSPRARIKAIATAGAEPVIMLTAPTPASKLALAQAGMVASDIDLWEINEAFAAIPLQTMKNLKIDHSKVNVNGGAIALGHPLGATGAILMMTAVDELERRNLNTALVTLCIGGGMGIATIVERV